MFNVGTDDCPNDWHVQDDTKNPGAIEQFSGCNREQKTLNAEQTARNAKSIEEYLDRSCAFEANLVVYR